MPRRGYDRRHSRAARLGTLLLALAPLRAREPAVAPAAPAPPAARSAAPAASPAADDIEDDWPLPRTVYTTYYLSAAHPSRLLLPVIPAR